MDDKVECTEEAIKDYLDRSIAYWMREKDNGSDIAIYYIDAFNSVRVSLFGKPFSL